MLTISLQYNVEFQEENPEGSDFESCVDFGLSLDIELTELALLKEKQKQVTIF